nr:atherin-like [Odocoileus virginianus texanus]
MRTRGPRKEAVGARDSPRGLPALASPPGRPGAGPSSTPSSLSRPAGPAPRPPLAQELAPPSPPGSAPPRSRPSTSLRPFMPLPAQAPPLGSPHQPPPLPVLPWPVTRPPLRPGAPSSVPCAAAARKLAWRASRRALRRSEAGLPVAFARVFRPTPGAGASPGHAGERRRGGPGWRQRLDPVASVLLRRASLRAVRVKAGGAARGRMGVTARVAERRCERLYVRGSLGRGGLFALEGAAEIRGQRPGRRARAPAS